MEDAWASVLYSLLEFTLEFTLDQKAFSPCYIQNLLFENRIYFHGSQTSSRSRERYIRFLK